MVAAESNNYTKYYYRPRIIVLISCMTFTLAKVYVKVKTSFKDGAFAALDANMRCIRSLPSIFALPASLGAAILRHCFRAPFVFSVEASRNRENQAWEAPLYPKRKGNYHIRNQRQNFVVISLLNSAQIMTSWKPAL